MNKIFKVANIRKLEQQVAKGEISYSRMVEIMNEMANKVECEVEKLPIPFVMPRSENLILKSGVHTIRVDVFEDYRKQPVCRITCIDDDTHAQDLDGEWIDEYTEGCFYANNEQIDQITEKLKEAKAFLNGV